VAIENAEAGIHSVPAMFRKYVGKHTIKIKYKRDALIMLVIDLCQKEPHQGHPKIKRLKNDEHWLEDIGKKG